MGDFKDEFQEWVTRGPGESMLGGVIKAAASTVRRRLQKKLETPNLFPHMEHEDRSDIARAEREWERGDKMVRRCQARSAAIDGILDADAGLTITDEDLRKPGR